MDARAVANALLGLARAAGHPLDLVETMHLVYYAHGWHLGIADAPLIDEEIQARSNGPIVGSLYEEGRRICVNPIPGTFLFPDEETHVPATLAGATPFARALVERVWAVYGGRTDFELDQTIRGMGSPWKMTWLANLEGLRQLAIRNSELRTHFYAQRLRTAQPGGAPLDAIAREFPRDGYVHDSGLDAIVREPGG